MAATAAGCDRPSPSRRWGMWRASGVKYPGAPRRSTKRSRGPAPRSTVTARSVRRSTVMPASASGRPSASAAGSTSHTPPSIRPTRLAAPSANPTTRLPESPRNMRWRRKLCGRNPSSAPARARSATPATTCSSAMLTSASASAAMAPSPPATPSTTSVMLRALVSVTIHRTPSTAARGPSANAGVAGPSAMARGSGASATTSVAAAISSTSLVRAERPRASSTMPAASTASAPTPSAAQRSAPSPANSAVRSPGLSTKRARHRERRGGADCDAAPARHRAHVDLAGVGLVQHAERHGEAPHGGREREAHHRRRHEHGAEHRWGGHDPKRLPGRGSVNPGIPRVSNCRAPRGCKAPPRGV